VVRSSGRPRNRDTEIVRAYWAVAGTSTRRAAREATGLERQKVDTAIDTLIRGKRLKHVGKSTYEWIPEKKAARLAPLEERIWHAMRINPSWCAADIAVQAGTSVAYVYKRLRAYRAAGYIVRRGNNSVPGGYVRIWALNSTGRDHIEVPRIEEYSPDPLIIATVRLNRLVCAGLIHFVDERREAGRLAAHIQAMLMEQADKVSREDAKPRRVDS
jgi:hypothetical protein